MLKIEDFEIAEMSEGLEGLTPKLLWDIHDIATKLGTIDAKNQCIDFAFKLNNGETVRISAPLKEEARFLIGQNTVLEGMLSVALKNGNVILWERQLCLKAAKLFVAEVDAAAWEKGLINKTTGERIQTFSFHKGPVRYRVKEVFKHRGSTMPVLLPGHSAKELIEMFDEPEKLMVNKDPLLQIEAICLKEDEDYLQRRREVVFQLLEEKGMRIEQVADMSVEEIIQLREEIDKKLKEAL